MKKINLYNSRKDYGLSVNALAMRLVELCRELSAGWSWSKIEGINAAAEAISVSFKRITEPNEVLRNDNLFSAQRIDKEVAMMNTLISRKRQ